MRPSAYANFFHNRPDDTSSPEHIWSPLTHAPGTDLNLSAMGGTAADGKRSAEDDPNDAASKRRSLFLTPQLPSFKFLKTLSEVCNFKALILKAKAKVRDPRSYRSTFGPPASLTSVDCTPRSTYSTYFDSASFLRLYHS